MLTKEQCQMATLALSAFAAILAVVVVMRQKAEAERYGLLGDLKEAAAGAYGKVKDFVTGEKKEGFFAENKSNIMMILAAIAAVVVAVYFGPQFLQHM